MGVATRKTMPDAQIELLRARTSGGSVRRAIGRAVEGGFPDWRLQYQLSTYHGAVAGPECRDFSVAVMHGGELAAFVVANDNADETLGYFGQPLRICWSNDVDEGARRQMLDVLMAELGSLSRQIGSPIRIVEALGDDGLVGQIGREALRKKGKLRHNYRLELDLRNSEQDLWRGLRKSYRSLINWGRRELQLTRIDQSNPDKQAFDSFEAFHVATAGRRTRSEASWKVMFDNICTDRAELLLGYFEDQLVAATFVNYSAEFASYATGVYERKLFNKPLSHWPVYASVLAAQNRGIKYFNLGQIYQFSGTDRKKANIGFFKKGFGDRVVVDVIWEIPSTQA